VEEFLDSPAPAVRVPTLIVIGRLDEVRQGRGDQGQEKSSVNSELHIGRRCRVAWYEEQCRLCHPTRCSGLLLYQSVPTN